MRSRTANVAAIGPQCRCLRTSAKHSMTFTRPTQLWMRSRTRPRRSCGMPRTSDLRRESRLTAAAAAERDRGLEDDLQDALYVSRNDAVRRAHVARDLARMRACNK